MACLLVPVLPKRSRFRLYPLLALALLATFACEPKKQPETTSRQSKPPRSGLPAEMPVPWKAQPVLKPGQVFALSPGRPMVQDEKAAREAGLLVVDLGDAWFPLIFSETDADPRLPTAVEPKVLENPYRKTFVALANDEVSPELLYLRGDGPTKVVPSVPQGLAGRALKDFERERDEKQKKRIEHMMRQPVHNYLEAFGIPPTLSVLARRLFEDNKRTTCYELVRVADLAAFPGSVSYIDIKQSRSERSQVDDDARWLLTTLRSKQAVLEAAGAWQGGTGTDAEKAALSVEPRAKERIERLQLGTLRLAAISAAQARLRCEGFIDPTTRLEDGTFDLTTHEALALWERKNNIFSWGILGGDTLAALQRPPLELQYETFTRILTERIVDAAGIIEDGTTGKGADAPKYKDAAGETQQVRNRVEEYREALMSSLGVRDAASMQALLDTLGDEGVRGFRVAILPPKEPDYMKDMAIEIVIARGDVWYDFPLDDEGKAAPQLRQKYPRLVVLAAWNGQKIPLARWRTTIGSWRSEKHPDGKVYYKYKNSDVGSRIWKHIVAAPVWIPPDGTPAHDLLTRKKFEAHAEPEVVVNTEIMGPGFGSAYGLVMAIHHEGRSNGNLFDNQIRTHGSVDYTSIARRYSHGCHRLVNMNAVRLFGFVLHHTPFERSGSSILGFRKKLVDEGQTHEFSLGNRGYYYKLQKPIRVEVLEGNIKGRVKKPIAAFVRKPGLNYLGDEAIVLPEGEIAGPAAGDPAAVAAVPAPAAVPVPVAPPAPPIIDPAQARGEKPADK
ncbi:MAG: murein L,D-transpeptidase [Deltaproteobacteria bacterium]|nr:murein L,D-transpeptidase [Deltaproteobacteria bacterium]